MTPQEFVAKWRKAELKEIASAQSHFIDLCRLLGQPTPTDIDPTGEQYTFEKSVSKSSGGSGRADVWKRGHFAWEYKGPGRSLQKAYDQLLRYKDALENPPLMIVSDIHTIVIHTNFTNTVKTEYRFELDDLLDPAKLDLLSKAFTDPREFRVPKTPDEVTREAAEQFAKLAEKLRERGADPTEAAHFLIRLLFCLFAEDVHLLPDGLFTKLVSATRHRADSFKPQMSTLFGAMQEGGFFGVDPIKHFNGGLFDSAVALDLDGEDLTILEHIGGLNWADMEPAIFGTLFERSLDPSKRSQLGAHYTSKEDILLIVEPVLMAPLRRRWDEVRAEADKLVADMEVADTNTKKENRRVKLLGHLREFADAIAAVKVLDPACGSGNFLYVALRQLLDLQKEVIVYSGEATGQAFYPTVSPDQVHGIELNEYAHELAQVTIWIGYIQWLRENGFGAPTEPILKPIETIEQRDAILMKDSDGAAVEPAWPAVDVIIGNPPFLGDKKMRSELGSEYLEALWQQYGNRLPAQSDLVCYWFEKSRAAIEHGRARRAGLLATQAIRSGANRAVLDRIKETGDIFMAYSDRNWVLDGATVHVSMIGFDRGTEVEKELNGASVNHINSDLTAHADLTQARKLHENQGISFIGTVKTGPFDIPASLAKEMLSETGNPNGRPNSDVVKRWINGTDITRRSRDMWIIDFGPDMSLPESSEYTAPFEYVRRVVKPVRDNTRRQRYRERWWLFGETRPGMRNALRDLERYIGTPMVSKHRVFAWVSRSVIPENLVVAIARDDDYFMGVLHCSLHELWSRNLGSQLRDASSGQRYTPSTTFETFPFPWPPDTEPTDSPLVQAIADAASELVEKRDNWLNPEGASEKELKKRTLTNLYNQRPTWLDLAHKRLDEAVLDAYGWPHDIGDEEILERLLALNLERAAQ